MSHPDFKGYIMPAMIPAAPGTCLVELTDVGVIRIPLVAWVPDAENPYRAPLPVTVKGIANTTNRGVEFGNGGFVHDARASVPFANVDEWEVFADKAPLTEEKPKPKPSSKPAAKASAKTEDEGGLKIIWTTKPFKQNSFYRYDDGNLDFLFQVDGGLNPPKQKDPVVKIKRDEFMSLKKTMDVADYEALLEGRAPGMDEIGSYDDDDLIGGGDTEEEIDDDDLI